MADQLTNLFQSINWPSFYFPRFGLNSVLDIALIAFVIYKVLMWIKQTRAWTLFKGIVIVMLIYLGAFLTSMFAVTWVIEQSFQVVAIAVIIIFQPEIRKALERIGKSQNIPFIGSLDDKNGGSVEAIEEIVIAAAQMSKEKTGALMVVEQQVPLGDLEITGVKLDALITSQLLISIFENKTPLHDGAVIVRHDRVKAASCILPLTGGPLSQDLGTRHRAAVGISEISDAYAICVSEETGRISVAKEGRLYRNLNTDELRRMLLENIKPTKARRRGKRGKKHNEAV